MKSKIFVTLIAFISVIIFSESVFGKCSDTAIRKGQCTNWGADYDARGPLPTGSVPKELLVEPVGGGETPWYKKAVSWLSSDTPGTTQINTNVTIEEKNPPTARKIRELPEGPRSSDEVNFTPVQMKILAKYNGAIQTVYLEEANAYRALETIKNKAEPLLTEIANVEKEIQPLAKESDACRENPKDNARCVEWLRLGGDTTTKKLGLLRDKKGELAIEVASANRNFENAYEKYRTSQAEVNSVKQKVEGDRYIHHTQAREYELALRRAELRNAFQDARFDLMTVDHRLDLLESEFDKQDIGIYIQAKMGALLTSDILCQSAKKCVKGEPREYKPEELRELFKELKDTSTSRERSREVYRSTK